MSIGIRHNIKVDDAVLMEHLEMYSRVMGLGMAEVIRKQSGLFCLDMIKYTRPFASEGDGNTSGAKRRGMDLVAAQIKHIFSPLAKANTKQIASIGRYDVFKMWEKERWQEYSDPKGRKARWADFQQKYATGKAPAFIDAGDMSTMGSVHKSLRSDGGHGPLKSWVASSKSAFAIVKKSKDIEKYIKSKQKDVGTLKSGYWFAAEAVKAKVTGASWFKQAQGRQYAIAEDGSAKVKAPEITVGNSIGKKGFNSSLLPNLMNRRGLSMRSEMARKFDRDGVALWKACADGKIPNPLSYFT
jgi:hypothetical protein